MRCPHCYFYPGYRSFGGDIPSYAWGTYFPGDERGERCRLTGDPCDPDPRFCPREEDDADLDGDEYLDAEEPDYEDGESARGGDDWPDELL